MAARKRIKRPVAQVESGRVAGKGLALPGGEATEAEEEDGRDIGMMISYLTVAVRQLAARIEALESAKPIETTTPTEAI
ncbi:MAG TPA: hypothetical protein VFH17_05045 [Coriobacteriia bacterium]|nr:hypothetical protein [Coriobacteriia bacterium]